jgi:hypothetical protein
MFDLPDLGSGCQAVPHISKPLAFATLVRPGSRATPEVAR